MRSFACMARSIRETCSMMKNTKASSFDFSTFLICTALFLLGGYFFFLHAIPDYWKLIRSFSLEPSLCLIEESKRVSTTSAQNSMRDDHSFAVRYRYFLDGQERIGTKYQLFATSTGSKNTIERLVAKYPPGSRVECFVSSSDKDFAVLEASPDWVGLLLATVIPLGLIFFSVRVFLAS